ncbi:MAG: hypothetical protein ACXWCB_09470 [Acidimicrobiales bacterium]
MNRRLLTALVGAALLGGVVAGCSSSGPSAGDVPSTVGPQSTVPESSGFTCNDPTGDVVDAARQTEMLEDPSGIDLVTAEAHVDGDALAVSFTTAGPISLAPDPFFDLLQGSLDSPAYSFELRAEPGPGDTWKLGLTDFSPLATAGGQAVTTGLSAPVTVTGNQLSYRVPLTTIPKISTMQWNFGSSSTQADKSVRIDDCTSLTSSSTGTTEPIVTVPPGN